MVALETLKTKSSVTARRARVLAITSELPWPLNTGGHIRTFHLLRALAGEFNVRLLTVIQPDKTDAVEQLQREGINVQAAVVGPRRPWQEIPRVLGAALRREPYVLYRRHNRAALRRLIQQELNWQKLIVADSCKLKPATYINKIFCKVHKARMRLRVRVLNLANLAF